MNAIYSLISQWVEQKLLPSAVIRIMQNDKVVAEHAFGQATTGTMYDIASLTKVTATLPAILLLAQAKELSLQQTVSHFIPQFPHKQITLEHCLKHRTGLPGSLPYPQNRYSEANIWDEIFALPLLSLVGQQMRYSDVGMILVGKVIEMTSNQTLAEFAEQHIFKRLNMHNTLYCPPQSMKQSIAPTEWDAATQTYLQGKVHDEVSFRLGGISGSAGLFSTAEDLSTYAGAWLYPEKYPLLANETIMAATQDATMSRGLGWQIQDFTTDQLSCGMKWAKGSFGHTGFTGTSLWIEPTQKVSVVFLTNAVHFGRETKIIELRKLLHDEIYKELLA